MEQVNEDLREKESAQIRVVNGVIEVGWVPEDDVVRFTSNGDKNQYAWLEYLLDNMPEGKALYLEVETPRHADLVKGKAYRYGDATGRSFGCGTGRRPNDPEGRIVYIRRKYAGEDS